MYYSIKEAAERLGFTPEALRARCRRGAVDVGKSIESPLGDGVVAVKFRRTWRVRFA